MAAPLQVKKSRQNIILALVHALLAVIFLVGFVYIQTRK